MKYLPKVSGNALGAAMMLFLGLSGLISCGGVDQTAGIEGTGDKAVSAGTVTGFGSIYVNGIRYDTSAAAITVNDHRFADESALQLGMVVRVEGRLSTSDGGDTHQGVADAVFYDRILKGHIDAVEIHGERKTLKILGQAVVVEEDITFAGVTFSDLAVGTLVEISGVFNEQQTLVATRVALAYDELGPLIFDVEGFVTAVGDGQTFDLGELTVDFSSADMDLAGASAIAPGQRLEVQGHNYMQGVLTANSVRSKTHLKVPVNTHLQLEGVVEQWVGREAFVVNGISVDATDADVKRGDAAHLANGVRVSIHGVTVAENRLRATQVTLLLPAAVKVKGMLESIDADSGQFTVLGTRFRSDRLTAFDDRSAAPNRRLNLGELAVGDVVEVFGRPSDGDDEYLATRIQRVGGDIGATTLKGPVTSVVDEQTFYLMNFLIDAADAEGAGLVAELARGDKLEVEGILIGSRSLRATRISRVD